ncbi:MAG: DUF4349 domain-containing protein [Nannocystaceae bacterium]|nr:DUF4349 domain-containing protein [Nannocystaceae bacterium]
MGMSMPVPMHLGVEGTSMEAVPPTAVLGSPPPKSVAAHNPGSDAQPAIEEMRTTGADSVDQMIIFTGQLALEVDFSTTSTAIDDAVAIAVAAGGYVAKMTDTTLQLRVPSKRFRRSMKQLEGLGDVRSRGVQAMDVSEEFHDIEVRLDNLKATRARIAKLLASSKDLSQILTIEKELQRVTLEIDRIEGRLRLLASQAAFSTLAIGFSERPEPRQGPLEVAKDTAAPPPPPRTLRSAAAWIGEVRVHELMSQTKSQSR